MRLILSWSFCLLIFLFGCTLNPAPPFQVPTVNQIESIDIHTGHEYLLTIQDKSKMAKILKFLEEHNEGWQYESPDDRTILDERYPYAAVFTETKDPRTRLIIWFGNRGIWISEGEFPSSNRFKSLSVEEEEELFDLIGIVSEKSR